MPVYLVKNITKYFLYLRITNLAHIKSLINAYGNHTQSNSDI